MTTRAWLLVAVSALIIAAVGVLTALQSNAPPTGIFDPQCGACGAPRARGANGCVTSLMAGARSTTAAEFVHKPT